MNLIRVILALGFLLASLTPAAAQRCETLEATALHFEKLRAGSKTIAIRGARFKRFLQAFNASPPVTNYTADAAAMVFVPGQPHRVYLALYHGNCLKHKGAISRTLAEQLLEASNPGRETGEGA